jgi:hypothetical protein
VYAQAEAAGWREHLPFGGWGSAEAAARAKAEGWKGGSAPGEEGGLGVTNSQKSSFGTFEKVLFWQFFPFWGWKGGSRRGG